jgi:type II secretory pathway pseudopilin PulG
MLVVMGIIVLVLALAVPTVRLMTGSRSEQAAQNTVAAFLSRTRAEAIGLQQAEGVLFYLDLATDRITLAQVWPATIQPSGLSSPVPVYLDLVPDRDTLVLPSGIRLWTIKDQIPSSSVNAIADPLDPTKKGYYYRYLGYNPTLYPAGTVATTTDKAVIGGVILFDGHGQVATQQYGFEYCYLPLTTPPTTTGVPTALAQLVFSTTNSNAIAGDKSQASWVWPAPSTSPRPYLRSQVGFVLFNREVFLNTIGTSSTLQFTDGNYPTSSAPSASIEQDLDTRLDQNATPLLVNRFNGTLTRGE